MIFVDEAAVAGPPITCQRCEAVFSMPRSDRVGKSVAACNRFIDGLPAGCISISRSIAPMVESDPWINCCMRGWGVTAGGFPTGYRVPAAGEMRGSPAAVGRRGGKTSRPRGQKRRLRRTGGKNAVVALCPSVQQPSHALTRGAGVGSVQQLAPDPAFGYQDVQAQQECLTAK